MWISVEGKTENTGTLSKKNPFQEKADGS